MLVPRTILMPLGLGLLGSLSPSAVHEVRSAIDGLDDRKMFAAIAVRDPSMPSAMPQPARLAAHGGMKLTRSNDGLFYVNAIVNDQPIRFVVDTGSSMVVLAKRDAARLALDAKTKSGRVMQTANGTVRIQTASLRHVRIGGQSVRHVEAAIVREGLPTSLLGQNLLSQLGPITIEGDQLNL